MKAVVLVGGEGTRMRPLTETMPKPLIPLVDRPFLDHVLDHLARHGVDEVLLSSPYLEKAFSAFLDRRRGKPALTWITEDAPLGTGGAVAKAARSLDRAFLVLNGDILTDLDLTALVEAHRSHGAVATITLSAVDDARPYGLVAVDADGRVREFREKPPEAVAGLVNAGTYVLEPSAVRGVGIDRAVSIEREVFPGLIAGGAAVWGFVTTAYWIDLGTPEKYLRASFDALEGRIGGLSYAAPHVDPSADVSLRAQLGRWVVVGPGARIEEGARVEDSVILAGAVVEEDAAIRDSILGPAARVGRGAVVEDAIVAERAVVPARSTSSGVRLDAGSALDA
jgi:mannose-1-phosphate guanylyltransferase